MLCPTCKQEMKRYQEEPCFSKTKRIEYTRVRYKCEKDDVWGQLEIPVGPMSQSDVDRMLQTAK